MKSAKHLTSKTKEFSIIDLMSYAPYRPEPGDDGSRPTLPFTRFGAWSIPIGVVLIEEI
jgi:hypothetical protein